MWASSAGSWQVDSAGDRVPKLKFVLMCPTVALLLRGQGRGACWGIQHPGQGDPCCENRQPE